MINLGDKNWGVKDSGLLAYKQVGSKYFNKDFDFTRASNGTYVDKNGVLQTAELYNLIDYSQDFSQWTKIGTPTLTNNYGISPFGVQNSTRVQAVSGNRIYLSIIGNSSTYTYSIYAKGSGTLRIRDNSGTYYLEISPTSEWVRYDYSFTASFTNIQIEFIATSDVEIYGAQLVEGTEPLDYQYTNGRVGIPRIDFSDGVGALLLEGQRSNLITYSEDWTQSVWVKRGFEVNNTTEQGPLGTSNAIKITENNTDNNPALYFNPDITDGTDRTFSVWGKASENIDIALCTQGSTLNDTISLTTEWQKFEVTSNVNTYLGPHIGGFSTIPRGCGVTFYFAMPQQEAGSYATSYIKTEGSTVTRTADVANNCGSEQDFNSEEGVLYAEIKTTNSDSTLNISLSDGTNVEYIKFIIVSSSATIRAEIGYSGGNNSIPYYGYSYGDIIKMAFVYSASEFKFFVNGNQQGSTIISHTLPSNLSSLQFDRGDGSAPFYGKVRSVKYFPEALTDEQLENLTT